MEQKMRGIVIRTVKYGDNKIIVDLLTREHGRTLVVSRCAGRGGGRRLQRQIFQPLSILEVTASGQRASRLPEVKEALPAEVYGSLPYDGVKMSVAFFIAEFLTYATRSQQTDAQLYDFVEQSLLWFDATDKGAANFHLMFMMQLSMFLGFHPDTDDYADGCLFDLREGRFCMQAPVHPDFLHPDEASRVSLLMRMRPHNLHLFRMSRHERNRAADIILRFYRIHVPQFGEMRSLAVLREL